MYSYISICATFKNCSRLPCVRYKKFGYSFTVKNYSYSNDKQSLTIVIRYMYIESIVYSTKFTIEATTSSFFFFFCLGVVGVRNMLCFVGISSSEKPRVK